MQIVKLSSAHLLSGQWDGLADSYFQRSTFLYYTEVHNPCKQRYYEVYEGDELKAGACVYELKLDLFTYSNIRSPIVFTIVGIPASISDAGIFGDISYIKGLINHIFDCESGLLVVLNVPVTYHVKPSIILQTLPTIEFRNRFSSWKEYHASLRSKYRRRLNIINGSAKDIQFKKHACAELDEKMYALYKQIMNKTKTKLEVLSYDFFLNLPDEFQLNACRSNGNVISWNICLSDRDRFVFFFGGLDYQSNRRFNAYFNNLASILKEGIEKGYKTIEFGQTAEVPKLKLGGELIRKYMLLYHKKPLSRAIIHLLQKLIEYRYKIPEYQVFKNEVIN